MARKGILQKRLSADKPKRPIGELGQQLMLMGLNNGIQEKPVAPNT